MIDSFTRIEDQLKLCKFWSHLLFNSEANNEKIWAICHPFVEENFMLYEKDFLAWTQQRSELIRQGRWQEVDLDHLIEELEDMGKSNHQEL